MLKYFVLIINSLILFITGIIYDDVNITPHFPARSNPNNEFVAEINISKEKLSGFAKLQLEFPEGFVIEAIESSGSAFTFENNQAKFIWSSLPAENELNLKFKVKTNSVSLGLKEIKGKFFYILNNEKKIIEIAPILLTIEEKYDDYDSGIDHAWNDSVYRVQKEDAHAPQYYLSCKRKIIYQGKPGQYKVHLILRKEKVNGYAKLIEQLPHSKTKVIPYATNGASFSVVDDKIKFVWVSLPKEETMHVEYQLIFSEPVDTSYYMNGAFFYVEDDMSKKIQIDGDEFLHKEFPKLIVGDYINNKHPQEKPAAINDTVRVEPQKTVDNTVSTTVNTAKQNEITQKTSNTEINKTDSPKVNIVVNTTVVNKNSDKPEERPKEIKTSNQPSDNPVKTNNDANNKTTSAKTAFIAQVNTNQNQLFYTVQIGAYKSAAPKNYYKRKYNIVDEVKTDMHDGFTKCLLGQYNEYKQARDNREAIRSKGVAKAFVAAYNSGKRITVQEALMVSNQKWFK